MIKNFNEIKNDLTNDFPNIESIEEIDNEIKIISDKDTLWEIFDVLFGGVENIELNLDKEEKPYITIKI